MKRLNQMLALLLAMILIVSTLAACGGQQDATPDETEVEINIITTPVQYSKSGSYTTTVTSEKVDLSGVTAENIEVLYYIVPDDTATPDETASEEARPSRNAEITSVSKNGDGWDIAFTDPDAAEYATAYYVIDFTDLKDAAVVTVEFPEIGLEPDLAYITPVDDVIKLTLALSGSEFDGEVTADDLVLENAFSGMEIESVSAAGQNLTVQLKGTLERNIADAYQCGTVSVSPKVIKDGYAFVPADVPVRLESACFDAATMKYADGKITGDFKVYGVADAAELTEDNVKIDGVTVEAVEKVDDNTVKLTLTAEGADSVNAFADLVIENAITLGDYEGTVTLSQASFYPVYDMIEADGDNLKLTLKLYAFDGTFADDFSAESISFGDEFEEAKAESLTADSDTLATLILTVPADGMTADTFEAEGTVTVAAGSMINAWGDKSSSELTCSRVYNAETLGKGIWDSIKSGLKKIGNAIVDGVSTVGKYIGNGVKKLVDVAKDGIDYAKQGLGYVTEYLGLGDLSDLLGGYLGGGNGNTEKLDKLEECSKLILGELGAVQGTVNDIQTDVKDIKNDIKDIKSTLNTVLDNQYTIMQQLDVIATELKIGQNDTYRNDLASLQYNIELVSKTYELGAVYMALEDAVADGRLDKMPSFKKVPRAKLDEALEPYRQYLPDVSAMTVDPENDIDEAADYNDAVIDYIDARSKNSSDVEFKSFWNDYNNLKAALQSVAEKLSRTDSTNPLTRYDEVCAYQYNFDSQAFEFRASTRLTAVVLLSEGMELVTACEKGVNYPNGATFDTMDALVTNAMARVIEIPIGHAPEDIKANGKTDKDSTYYPYSYVLKKKICILDSTENDLLYRDLRALNKDQYRNWTQIEINSFFNRMGGKTLQQEFASAGINITSRLATEYLYFNERIDAIRWKYIDGKFYNLNATSANSVTTESKTDLNKVAKYTLINLYSGY